MTKSSQAPEERSMFCIKDKDQNNFRLLKYVTNIFKVLKKTTTKLVTYSSIPSKNIFKSNKGGEKTYIQIQKEFMTSRPALQ